MAHLPPFLDAAGDAACRLADTLDPDDPTLAITCRRAVLCAVAAHYGGPPPFAAPALPTKDRAAVAPPDDMPAEVAVGETLQYLLARRFVQVDGRWTLAPMRGSRRKTSGSFYTPPALVERLLATTLDPLIAARAGDAEALLGLRVLDPAAGVGYFLTAAAGRLAAAVTEARGDGDADTAMQAVLSRCIHGVDLDPTAAALCRWSLARLTTRPVPSLEQAIRCGNSLVGAPLDSTLSRDAADAWTAEKAGAAVPQVLHWHLAFPAARAAGGFDCIVGNPPWERAALEDVEYFAARDATVAGQPTTALRQAAISQLAADAPTVHHAWQSARDRQAAFTRFCQRSGRYRYGARGRLNTYALFANLAMDLCAPTGRWGLLLPTGIATDAPMRDFWRHLVDDRKLLALIDFENTDGIFDGVHHEQKFCILVAAGATRKTDASMRVGFWLRRVDDHDATYDLPLDAFDAISPNTGQPTPVRTWRDLLLLRWIYSRVPPMWHDARDTGTARAWVGLTSSSWSQHLRQEPGPDRLPMMEAKLMHQYDPAYASYADSPARGSTPTQREHTTGEALTPPRPRYWMDADVVAPFLAQRAADRDWLLCYRDVTNVNNARTTIAAVVPATGLLQPLNGIAVPDAATACRVLAVLNSFACDYVARQRFTGRHLNVTTFSQLPMPTAPWPLDPVTRVARLSCTLPGLAGFARACGQSPEPVPWDAEERWRLRCELDAAVLYLYLGPADAWPADAPAELRAAFPLPTDAAAWMLDQFPVVRRREVAAHGHARSRAHILALYSSVSEEQRAGARVWT